MMLTTLPIPRIVLLALAGAMAFSLVSCISPVGIRNGGRITKVNKYHLNPDDDIKGRAADKMISNERRRRLHGAVSPAEIEARQGVYFTVFWKTENPDSPATVRFEYIMENTVDTIHVKETEVAGGSKSHVTEFSVVADEYDEHGVVLAYRISVEQNDRTIADHKSYLWE